MDEHTRINKGINQTGGEIRAHNIGVGENVTITDTQGAANQVLEAKGLQEISAKLSQLEEALKVHIDSLENPDEILDSTKKVAEELRRGKPNKLTVTAILNGIADGAKSVTGIASAVEALKAAIAALL